MLLTMRACSVAPRSNRGVTLVETLVALVVISIGLLGIAKMQALAIVSTRISSMRSLIAIEASSMASAIHANRAYWTTAGPANLQVSLTSGSGGGTITSSTDSALQASSTNCQSAQCVGAPMAEYDLKQWGGSLYNVMPTSTASVACSGTQTACTITVNWTESYTGANSATQYANNTPGQTFTMVVQP
jgi:type IV pilus assembly protein PilV